MSKYRGFNHISANSADISKVNFGKLHSVDKLLIKESEKILSAKYSIYLVCNTAKNGHDLLPCDIEAFIIQNFRRFCFLKMYRKNESFCLIDIEGDGLLKHMPKRYQ